jgi:hypothetical protein
MARRLFTVTSPFTADHAETGKQRTLKPDERLFAEFPVQSTGVVFFEQDNQEFKVDAGSFIASTRLAKPQS